MTTATVCFKQKSNICVEKFGNLGANGVKGSKFLVQNATAADTSSLCRFLRDFFLLFYNLITLVTTDVLVYFWHKYSAEKWIYLQKCK